MRAQQKAILLLLVLAITGVSAAPAVSAVHPPLWQNRVVDNNGDVGQYCSLARSSGETTAILYLDETNDNLKLAMQDTNLASWTVTTVDASGKVGFQSSLAIDPSDRIHASYYNYTGKALYYYFNGPVTYREMVDGGGDVGIWNSLAVSAGGLPAVSYYDSDHTALKYASKLAGSGWDIETVDDSADVGIESSLALDEIGCAHISYYDATNKALKYAYQDAHLSWFIETIDSNNAGWWSSIALDSGGPPSPYSYPYISYYGGSDLRVAWKDHSWVTQIETADSLNDVGTYTSLALDRVLNPRISYYDFSTMHLKYAWKDVGGWHSRTIDDTPHAGWYTSLALDSHENSHVAYYDSWNQVLKYAWTGYNIGVFRPSASKNWIVDYEMNRVVDERRRFGAAGDIPLAGDLNNDDVADRAVFRQGYWIVDCLIYGWVTDRDQYGMPGDIPLIGDFNNDGITDRAVFRKGEWIYDYNFDRTVNARNHYGMTGDIPLIGDFNNDGITDRVVFRRGEWIFDYTMDGSINLRDYFGIPGDIPFTGQLNYDGFVDQSVWDRGVYRNGEWIVDLSIDGTVNERFKFGVPGDLPIVY